MNNTMVRTIWAVVIVLVAMFVVGVYVATWGDDYGWFGRLIWKQMTEAPNWALYLFLVLVPNIGGIVLGGTVPEGKKWIGLLFFAFAWFWLGIIQTVLCGRITQFSLVLETKNEYAWWASLPQICYIGAIVLLVFWATAMFPWEMFGQKNPDEC